MSCNLLQPIISPCRGSVSGVSALQLLPYFLRSVAGRCFVVKEEEKESRPCGPVCTKRIFNIVALDPPRVFGWGPLRDDHVFGCSVPSDRNNCVIISHIKAQGVSCTSRPGLETLKFTLHLPPLSLEIITQELTQERWRLHRNKYLTPSWFGT